MISDEDLKEAWKEVFGDIYEPLPIKKAVIFDLENVMVDFTQAYRLIISGNHYGNELLLSHCKICPGIPEILSLFKLYGIQICVISRFSDAFVTYVIDYFKLSINYSFGRVDKFYNVSYPKQLMKAVNVLGVEPSDIIAFCGSSLSSFADSCGIEAVKCDFTHKDASQMSSSERILGQMHIELGAINDHVIINDCINLLGRFHNQPPINSKNRKSSNYNSIIEDAFIVSLLRRSPNYKDLTLKLAARAGWIYDGDERLGATLFVACLSNIYKKGAYDIKDEYIRGGMMALEADEYLKSMPRTRRCPTLDIAKSLSDKALCEEGIRLFQSCKYKEAISFFNSLTDNIWSCYYLGLSYRSGFGVKKNLKTAISYLEYSALKGLPEAAEVLGIIYETSYYYLNHQILSCYWYWVAFDNYQQLADKDYPEAQESLAWCYIWGRGVDISLEEAETWFLKAADNGYLEAFVSLSIVYSDFVHDLGQAEKWLNKAIEKDYPPAIIRCAINAEFDNNSTAAFNYYLKAANLGDINAQYAVGCYYHEGIGVKKDMDQALYWTELAANNGDIRAQCNMGVFYQKGEGVVKDFSKAIEWYQRSAENGNRCAQNNLGECYFYGLGVPSDYRKAIRYFRKAANQRLPDAQNWMGVCFRDGKGVEQNTEKAKMWFSRAAKSGNNEAINNISKIENQNK